MAEYPGDSSFYSKSPFYQLFTALVYILVIGGGIFLLLVVPALLIFDPEVEILRNPLLVADKKDVLFLQYMLICQHVSLFIIPGIILIIKLKKPASGYYPELRLPSVYDIVYVIILAVCLFPVTGLTGEFNSGLRLPDWLSGIESWMRGKEDMAERLFDVVLAPEDRGSLVINFIMIAILPAIGEELIFRGIIQRILAGMFRSGHLAVWVTAFLFSALHFQFYGFLPRFILGLVFGYLFFWSGTLWLPVVAHFINNAVSVAAAYSDGTDMTFIQNGQTYWQLLVLLLIPLLAVIVILNYFRKKAESDKI